MLNLCSSGLLPRAKGPIMLMACDAVSYVAPVALMSMNNVGLETCLFGISTCHLFPWHKLKRSRHEFNNQHCSQIALGQLRSPWCKPFLGYTFEDNPCGQLNIKFLKSIKLASIQITLRYELDQSENNYGCSGQHKYEDIYIHTSHNTCLVVIKQHTSTNRVCHVGCGLK